jgi:hypothetical protein
VSTSSKPLGDAVPAIDFPDVLSRRVNADPERVERGLAQLVLTVVELLRQLMERQALRRIEGGTLDDEEIERMEELTAEFGLEPGDLNLNLGPLGDLVD